MGFTYHGDHSRLHLRYAWPSGWWPWMSRAGDGPTGRGLRKSYGSTSMGIVDPQLEVSCAQAEEAVRADAAQVVDVREPYEWEAGRVSGARHIELERLGSSADTIDATRPVIFQCRAGIRSAMAAQAFRRAGYDAWSMAGGLEAWAAAGLPLEPRDGCVAPH